MSNAYKGLGARRGDPTRTAQAKRETIARREARALKAYAPREFDSARISTELEAN